MDISELQAIKLEIFHVIGVKVDGRIDSSGPRKGLVMWFENYTSQQGPRFSIRPSGLKRHTIVTKFGNYSKDCIKHIIARANRDDYQTALAHISTLEHSKGITLTSSGNFGSGNIEANFEMKAIRKNVKVPHDSREIIHSVDKIIIPMMAAMAELIGYEQVYKETEDYTGEVDGKVSWSLSKRRERNPRNRLLCLSIKGEQCGVCGFRPTKVLPEPYSQILEVHHIEPLSEAGKPKTYNPATDLIPLCPNCHRAIHRTTPALKPDELKKLLKK